MAEKIVQLPAAYFDKFMDVLDIIGKSCDDVVIKKGKICQKSNKRTVIFQIDLEPLLGKLDLSIASIGSKLKMLSPLRKQQANMELVVSDNNYVFRDAQSSVEGRIPLESHLTNRFTTQEDLDRSLNLDTADTGGIMECEMGKFLIDRLQGFCDGLAATLIRLDFDGDDCKFTIRSMDNTSNTLCRLLTVDELTNPVEGYCSFPTEPFISNVHKWDATLNFVKEHRNVVLKLDSTLAIEEDKEVKITLYCLSQLKNLDELE